MKSDRLFLRKNEALVHLHLGLLHMPHAFGKAAVVIAVLAALELAFEVVVTWRVFLVAAGLAPVGDDFLCHSSASGVTAIV